MELELENVGGTEVKAVEIPGDWSHLVTLALTLVVGRKASSPDRPHAQGFYVRWTLEDALDDDKVWNAVEDSKGSETARSGYAMDSPRPLHSTMRFVVPLGPRLRVKYWLEMRTGVVPEGARAEGLRLKVYGKSA